MTIKYPGSNIVGILDIRLKARKLREIFNKAKLKEIKEHEHSMARIEMLEKEEFNKLYSICAEPGNGHTYRDSVFSQGCIKCGFGGKECC